MSESTGATRERAAWSIFSPPSYEIVVRYQGGNNAGHTVVNERGKFILNLLPSGILRPGTVNVLGPGMVLDLEHLTNEVAHIREQGVAITPEHLKISDRATICMPYHKMMDILEEDRLGGQEVRLHAPRHRARCTPTSI